jgi:hypothetical protein
MASALLTEEARVLGCADDGINEEEREDRPNIEANMDEDLLSVEDAPAGAESATDVPLIGPKALIPFNALLRRSSAISRFLSRVFVLIASIFSDAGLFPSFKVSSNVSARIPFGFFIPDEMLSEVLSIQ